ncbi:MAG: hypothetical protein ACREQI_06455 [Candidatus Binataceae bacterium]
MSFRRLITLIFCAIVLAVPIYFAWPVIEQKPYYAVILIVYAGLVLYVIRNMAE